MGCSSSASDPVDTALAETTPEEFEAWSQAWDDAEGPSWKGRHAAEVCSGLRV